MIFCKALYNQILQRNDKKWYIFLKDRNKVDQTHKGRMGNWKRADGKTNKVVFRGASLLGTLKVLYNPLLHWAVWFWSLIYNEFCPKWIWPRDSQLVNWRVLTFNLRYYFNRRLLTKYDASIQSLIKSYLFI